MANKGYGSGGALSWFLQRVSGVFLIVLLFIHTIFAHYYPGGDINFEKVVTRFSNPSWKFFDVIFLLFVLYHGANGMWILIQDYIENSGFRLFLLGVLICLVVSLFIIGLTTIISLKPLPL